MGGGSFSYSSQQFGDETRAIKRGGRFTYFRKNAYHWATSNFPHLSDVGGGLLGPEIMERKAVHRTEGGKMCPALSKGAAG